MATPGPVFHDQTTQAPWIPKMVWALSTHSEVVSSDLGLVDVQLRNLNICYSPDWCAQLCSV